MTDDLIQGSVALLVNSRELVINRGAEDGVREGMVFEVLAANTNDIRDPETGETLGSLHRRKVVVRVVQVEPKMAVARTFKSRNVNIGGAFAAFDKLFGPAKYVREYETLRADPAIWEELSDSESYVQVGDPVRQVIEEDGAASAGS